MSKSKKPKKLSAIDVLREFVRDVEDAYTNNDEIEILKKEWPDLLDTYDHAIAVLAGSKPTPFDQRRYDDPQGVIDDLIAQTTRQGVDIHHLTQALKSAEGEPVPANTASPKLFV